MSYTAEICRDNPTCFLFLVDQSGSMAAPFGAESGKTKAQGVADAINRLLQSLVMRCTKGHDVLDRYHIGVVGYGEEIGLGFTGDLAGEVLQPISQINEHPLRVEERRKKMDDGAGGLVEQTVKFPVWFEPVARGKTLMCGAIQAAQEVIREFVNQHPNCFPPIVINVTDGKATDGDPEPLAAALGGMTSSDGNVLFFNVHISERDERPILFPAGDDNLPDEYARLLFRMSSVFPPEMRKQGTIQEETTLIEGARGFAFNADFASVVRFLEIGTREDFRSPGGDRRLP
ncbi:MAG: vWA domain-containing protein [Thermoguttaceae bacterium]